MAAKTAVSKVTGYRFND